MNLRSFCSRAGLGYQELIVDDSLINKVYEITFSPAARSSTLGIPDGCVDVQFLGSGAQEECFASAFREGFDSGDHLHPSSKAYKAMAECAYRVLK